jgi:hypothetical protein
VAASDPGLLKSSLGPREPLGVPHIKSAFEIQLVVEDGDSMPFLKKRIASPTERPLSFMNLAGLSSRMRASPIRP